MQKRGRGGQIACKITYVINGRPLTLTTFKKNLKQPPPSIEQYILDGLVYSLHNLIYNLFNIPTHGRK